VKILFLSRSLNYGGAERQLVLLAKGLKKRGHEVVITLFYKGGPWEKELAEAQIPIRHLNKKGRWDLMGLFSRLLRVVREERPDIMHSYLYDQNLVLVALKPFFPAMRIIWGIRCSMVDLDRYEWIDRLSFNLNCWLSKFPEVIIANSQDGGKYHVSHGFPSAKTKVIPNGIDTDRFRPDPTARRQLRSEWGISEHEKLIGLVGRLDPMKDHPVFLKAAAFLANERKDTRFVCVGRGPVDYLTTLQTLAKSLGLEERLMWVGIREDMPAVHNALDICISSSAYGEGISNAVAEAMACGVPCVVTNIGDSAWLVGNRGEVIPPKDPVALKNAIDKLLDQRPYTSAQIRLRIVEHLSVEALVANTERALLTSSCGSPQETVHV